MVKRRARARERAKMRRGKETDAGRMRDKARD